MRGERVLVRGYRGEGRICRVLDVREDVVQLTDDEGFDCISKGEQTEKIVLFRLTDVFVDDGSVKSGSFPRWNDCIPYSAKVLH